MNQSPQERFASQVGGAKKEFKRFELLGTTTSYEVGLADRPEIDPTSEHPSQITPHDLIEVIISIRRAREADASDPF